VASKSGQSEPSVDIEELLDQVDKALDRVKVLYEQYFLGMQKQPPSHLHNDVERRLRDLMQISIRNTGLRYRFATLQQKFGSYNTYWRRTLRQIENGTYIRQLSKISRQAALTGEEVPEEILAAMPKRMRDQVKRDREQALAVAARRQQTGSDEFLEDAAPGDLPAALGAGAPAAPPAAQAAAKTREPTKGAHILSDDDFDMDFDSFFASMEAGEGPAPAPAKPAPAKPPLPTGTGPQPALRPSAPAIPSPSQTGPQPTVRFAGPSTSQTGPQPAIRPSAPAIPSPSQTGPQPTIRPPAPPVPPRPPVPPPGAGARPPAPPAAAAKRPEPGPPMKPPPGMNEADVNALYSKYVKAKEMVGETAGPGAYSKLMQTINAQAPKIMEQYKAKGVEFSVVVKDNQVVIKAKPKT
jgi:hypothetical protein